MVEDGTCPDPWSLDDTHVADYIVGSPKRKPRRRVRHH